MNETTDTKVARLESRIDPNTLANIQVSDAIGGVRLSDVRQVIEFAKMMATANQGVPLHLRGQHGFCFVICVQAIEWKMSPIAVANKSYVVNDRISYEAQLIHGVIASRGPIKGRIRYKFEGEGGTRTCTVTAHLVDEQDPVDYTTPQKQNIKPQNSPLWTSDPDQQLSYYAVRALARRHFPDVILGIYANDELAESTAPKLPPPSSDLRARLAGREIEGTEGFNQADVNATIDATATELPADQQTTAAEIVPNEVSAGLQDKAKAYFDKATVTLLNAVDPDVLQAFWTDTADERKAAKIPPMVLGAMVEAYDTKLRALQAAAAKPVGETTVLGG